MFSGQSFHFKPIFDEFEHQRLQEMCRKIEEDGSFTLRPSQLSIHNNVDSTEINKETTIKSIKKLTKQIQIQISEDQNRKEILPSQKRDQVRTKSTKFGTQYIQKNERERVKNSSNAGNIFQLHFKINYNFKNIINKLQSRRFKKITLDQINLINDLSYAYIEKQDDNKKIINNNIIFRKLSKFQHQILNKIKIIEPTSKINIISNIISIIINMGLFYLYSFKIFYNLEENQFTFQLQIIGIMINIQDIFLKIFVGYYDKGQIILNRKLIFRKYINLNIYLDTIQLLSIFVSTILVYISQQQYYNAIFYLNVLYFIKIISVHQIFNKLDQILYIIAKANYIYQLIKLIFKLIIMCHLVAICWHLLGQIEIQYFQIENTWLHELNIVDSYWYERYIESFYWSTTTIIILAGPKGSNPIEIIFQIIVMFATMGTFAYTMNCIGTILDEQNKRQMEYKKDLEVINKFMRKNNLRNELKQKVSNFLEYLYQEKGDIQLNKDSAEVLNKLPQNLKEDIDMEINQKIICKFKQIQNNFSTKVMKEVLHIIQEEYFLPNEVIFKNNQQDDLSIYWIQKGRVYIEQQQKNGQMIILKTLEYDNTFGDYQFFTGNSHEMQTRCADFTTLYKIERNNFLKIIQQHNEDYQKFNMIKDQLIYSNKTQFIALECLVCQSHDHRESNCHQIYYQQQPQSTLQKMKYKFKQERQTLLRRKNKTNAFHQIENLKEISYKIDNNDPLSLHCQFIDMCNDFYNFDQFSDENVDDSDDAQIIDEQYNPYSNNADDYQKTTSTLQKTRLSNNEIVYEVEEELDEDEDEDVKNNTPLQKRSSLFAQFNKLISFQDQNIQNEYGSRSQFESSQSIQSQKQNEFQSFGSSIERNYQTYSSQLESRLSSSSQPNKRNLRTKKKQRAIIIKQISKKCNKQNSQISTNSKELEKQISLKQNYFFNSQQLIKDVIQFDKQYVDCNFDNYAKSLNQKCLEQLIILYDNLVHKFNQFAEYDVSFLNQNQSQKQAFDQFLNFMYIVQANIRFYKSNDLFSYDFDKVQNFFKYFPKFNIKNLLRKIVNKRKQTVNVNTIKSRYRTNTSARQKQQI